MDYFESNGKRIRSESGGSESSLSEIQTQELKAHLEAHLYVEVSDICNYVQKSYGICYSVSKMADWLKRRGFTFHQSCGVPAKADVAAQERFVEEYEKLKNHMPDEGHIVFIDGAHPTHAVRLTRGWIKKGQRKEIPTNGSQKRLNILVALNLAEMVLHTHQYDTINGSNIVAFLAYLLTAMPVGIIHVILDQERYYTCQEIKEWLVLNPRIRLHYLPPYSPNLNSIESCWKIMREHTTQNRYHPTFKDFTERI